MIGVDKDRVLIGSLFSFRRRVKAIVAPDPSDHETQANPSAIPAVVRSSLEVGFVAARTAKSIIYADLKNFGKM